MSAPGQKKHRDKHPDPHENSLFHIHPLGKDLSSGFGFQGSKGDIPCFPLKFYQNTPIVASPNIPPEQWNPKRAFSYRRIGRRIFFHAFSGLWTFKGGSCKSHLPRHSGESRNPESIQVPGFRVALRLPGMTISSWFKSFAGGLRDNS